MRPILSVVSALSLPRPLISPEDLASALAEHGDAVDASHARVLPVDVRWKLGEPGQGVVGYAAGHLPGAIFLDLDTELADPNGFGSPGRHPLPDPAAFARLLGERGIGDDTFVVAYDESGGTVAARLWWMLDDLGHEAAAVLDGGLEAWRSAGLPLATEVPTLPPTEIRLRERWSRVIDRDALRTRLGDVVLLDVRAGERYRGEVEPIDPAPGHIPTARSAPTTANLGDDRRHRSLDVLAARYRNLGAGDVQGGKDTVVYCGSGVNATHSALVMRAAGLPDPIVYAGSYSDWTRSGLGVVSGPDPGEPPG